MKKTVQNQQCSSLLEQVQSIDWQKQFPVIVQSLIKGLSTCYSGDNKDVEDINWSDTSTKTGFQNNVTNVNIDYFTASSQAQKQFDNALCELYSSKRSIEEVLEVLEKEYEKHYTPEQLYIAVERATTSYKQWYSHGLNSVYPMIWVVPQRFKVVDEKGLFTNHIMYTLLAVEQDGRKDIIGTWIPRKESSSFWVMVFTELKNRGLSDIIFLGSNNIEGLKEAITAVFPKAVIIPNVALTLTYLNKYVLCKDQNKFSRDIIRIWNQKDIESASDALSDLESNWEATYPMVVRKVKTLWNEIAILYEFDNNIRPFLTSRDSIIKLYNTMRKSFDLKGFLPSDEAALRLAYISTNKLEKKWTAPFRNWGKINQIISLTFSERYPLL